MLPKHKTKIVATIGPASQDPATMIRLLEAGMNVARLNFSHGDLEGHRQVIRNLREASCRSGRSLAIMADLPGPKMRIGTFATEPVEVPSDAMFTLTTDRVAGNESGVSVSFSKLPEVVSAGDLLFLNDGIVQLRVERVRGNDVECRVLAGGELRSRKGLNIPGIDLGISAFTENDRRCLDFALAEGVDAVSQSFVENAADIAAVREAAARTGHHPFVIAKIERSRALGNLDALLEAADGVMVARGDLGVEIPIEQIAITQKRIIRKANCLGKPVITATQMLESMTSSRIPTRAEATDVANAILDGTDAVMLSGESAAGKFPVESVAMLSRIAEATEADIPRMEMREAIRKSEQRRTLRATDVISMTLETLLQYLKPHLIVVPTLSGTTARAIARFKPDVWIAAISSDPATVRNLLFSYGVAPREEPSLPDDWNSYVRDRLIGPETRTGQVILIEGPSPLRPLTNHRIEVIPLAAGPSS